MSNRILVYFFNLSFKKGNWKKQVFLLLTLFIYEYQKQLKNILKEHDEGYLHRLEKPIEQRW